MESRDSTLIFKKKKRKKNVVYNKPLKQPENVKAKTHQSKESDVSTCWWVWRERIKLSSQIKSTNAAMIQALPWEAEWFTMWEAASAENGDGVKNAMVKGLRSSMVKTEESKQG